MECDTISEELYEKLKKYPQFKGEFSSLKSLEFSSTKPIKGDIAYTFIDKSYYYFENNLWIKISALDLLDKLEEQEITSTPAAEMNTEISLYDMNKQLMKQQKGLSKYALQEKRLALNKYMNKQTNSYFMLLFRDINYYTVFRKVNTSSLDICYFGEELINCLQSFNKVYSIEIQDDNAIEIWIQDEEGEPVVGYLFPYDIGIVEFKE